MSRRRRSGQRTDRRRPDHFTKQAKEDGFAARSVYKLEEIQKRFRVLARGQRVVDLGCSPGSWSQYARQVIGGQGALLGVDLKEVPGYPGVQVVGDMRALTGAQVRDALGGPPDVVLSDMAPYTTGTRLTDHVRQLELAQAAADLAVALLPPGGHFIVKVFDGEDAHGFAQGVRPYFEKVRRLKPKATRDVSVEFFLLGLNRNDVQPGDGEE